MASSESHITSVPTTAAKVFATPELTEIILTYLPLADLIRATSVNCTLRDIIKSSTAIHRQLYLFPSLHSYLAASGGQLSPVEPFKVYLDFSNSLAFPGKANFLSSSAPRGTPFTLRYTELDYLRRDVAKGTVWGHTTIAPSAFSGDELWRRVKLIKGNGNVRVFFNDWKDNGAKGMVWGCAGDVTLGEVYKGLCVAAGFVDAKGRAEWKEIKDEEEEEDGVEMDKMEEVLRRGERSCVVRGTSSLEQMVDEEEDDGDDDGGGSGRWTT